VDVSAARDGGSAGFVRTGDLVTPLEVESAPAELAAETARALSPVVDLAAQGDRESELPRSVSFLSLAGRELASSVDAVIERWTESRSLLSGPYAQNGGGRRAGSLRALLGQSATGPLVLDLRTQGPHALVGGTTGSGKSELLQSWILGMASAHAPERVTFLLVDYKGGSAFSECVRLPHTVGLVTDLSPHLVRRALRSLSAELRYRERILHRKGAKDLLELERSGDPEAPPSLVIVVDEFAALVQEVPEFVDGVVNVAQRGRSLGLHLILATQRPAGVIKDNLRANTNLRLALRMADEADSTDVLGSALAASFDPSIPGRAVSRTGPSQLLPFQAAYVGGWTEEKPADTVQVEAFGFGPSRLWEVPQPVAAPVTDLGPTDIQRVVATIGSAVKQAQIKAPRLPWLPDLAPLYDLARLPAPRRDDSLVFGVVDDPDQQTQPTVAFQPDRDGNLAVFGTGGAGKSALLRTLAVASGFTVRGGPCHVYGIDFGTSGLQMLEELPHVGSIIAGTDHERISRLLGMLRERIDDRAVRYSRAGAGTITDYRRLSGIADEPRLLLLIDGMGAFRTAYEGTEYNRWFDMFLGIAADGRPVGVHVLLSADRPGALPTALGSLVQRRLLLRLADPNDYALLGAPSDVLDAKSPPGRGLLGDAEVQVAVLGGSSDVLEQGQAIRLFAESMRQAGGAAAPAIERLAEKVSLTDLPAAVEGAPVLGLSGVTLAPVGFQPRGTFLIAGPPGSGRTTALATVIASLRRWQPDIRLFYVGSRRSTLATLPDWERAAVIDAEASELAAALPGLAGEAAPGSPLCVVVIEAVPEFVGGPADFALQEMIKKLLAAGQLVVGEGETSALGSSYPLLVAMRGGRSGIALQPDQLDGNLLRVQFPRLRRADFPPGRGLFVSRGSQPVVIQVALLEAE
jgi:S-DNA-T family DNA segregation ATPase FtsK/SpoIIIE